MPLLAQRVVRKMRGGAQAHLIETTNGRFYVVKFRNNPQHRRILINELAASVFLKYLQISAPETALIEVTADFLERHPDLSLQIGSSRVPVTPGWHFGSRYPGNPDATAVYDFIPDALLNRVANLSEFAAVLVFDKWMANADGRQCIFFNARLKSSPASAADAPRSGFVVQMIDHGFVFDGPHWEFPDSPIQGLYHRPLVYEQIHSLDSFQPWLDLIMDFPEDVIDLALRQAPSSWLNGDEEQLVHLMERLLARRRRLPDLLAECRAARPAYFPNWQEGRKTSSVARATPRRPASRS